MDTDDMNPVYEELLREIGIYIDPSVHTCNMQVIGPRLMRCNLCLKECDLRIENDRCCGDEMEYSHGYLCCYTCARAIRHQKYEWYPTPNNGGKRVNEGYSFVKKRPYKKQQYFMNHFKRYYGTEEPVPDDEWVTELCSSIDMNHRDAYFHVREFLRKRKLSRYYKSIFSMIYQFGGVRPRLTSEQFTRVPVEINSICHYFWDTREDRRGSSMKCVPMLLEKILLQVGHVPYYRLHELKDEELREQVDEFYASYINDVVRNR